MAPLPKRKHSTGRKGRRMASRVRSLKNTVKCRHCQQQKRPHFLCQNCGK